MDFDNGSEFINHGVVRWAGNLDIYSRPLAPVQEERPGHHRDPRSNHVVRRYAFYYRYDTDAERRVPGRLWEPARHPSQLPDPHPQAHRVGR